MYIFIGVILVIIISTTGVLWFFNRYCLSDPEEEKERRVKRTFKELRFRKFVVSVVCAVLLLIFVVVGLLSPG